MNKYDVRVEAEVVTSIARLRLVHVHWPDAGEHIVCDRDEYVLTHRLSGEPALWLGALDQRVLGPSGLLQLKPPNMPIRVKLAPGWQKLFNCVFDPQVVEKSTGIRGNWDEDIVSLFCDIKDPFLTSIMLRLRHEVEKPGPTSEALLDAAGQLLIAELGNRWIRGREAASREIRKGGLGLWQLRAVKERIEALQLGTPHIDELARLCGLSQFHMMRKFKASTGITVHRYIENVRVTAAKQLLAQGDLSAKEVAFRLGFSSQRYFSAAFRRATTVTPREYRTHVRSGAAGVPPTMQKDSPLMKLGR